MAVTIAAIAAFAVLVLFPVFPNSSRKSPCFVNLETIQGAKINWMAMYDKNLNDTPTWDDLKPFFEDMAKRKGWKAGIPVCPQGGTYTIGPVNKHPKCSVGGTGHSMPDLPP
jgi:hypothetical protein